MIELRNTFLLFIIYSIIGWVIEIIHAYPYTKKITNRGFLIGPLCPIYGIGTLVLTYIFNNSNDDLFGIFAKSMIICAVLEYLTSYLMEKIFKKRWWDYSNRIYNLNGRICLENIFLFGIAGCLLVRFTNPFFINIILGIPDFLASILSIIILIIFIADIIISFRIIIKFRHIKFNSKDSTEDINQKVKEVINLNYISVRLVRAFPGLNESKLRKKS